MPHTASERVGRSRRNHSSLDADRRHARATSGSSGVVNEVELVYNAYGQLQFDMQEHGGAVVRRPAPGSGTAFARECLRVLSPAVNRFLLL
jgi:hypothetical protein